MKAKDLRIGNYIEKSLKSGQGRKLIDKIGCQDIVKINDNTGSFNYNPIQITEEWLIKFGFEESQFGYDFRAFSLYYNHKLQGDLYVGHWNEFECGNAIQYVHQLQNLYFALTGNELQIAEAGKI